MTKILSATALALVLSACATKGYVREQVGALKTATDANIAEQIAAERTARVAGDSTLQVDVAALRGALDSLRTEFNVKITAMENGIKFAFPVHFAFNETTVRDADRAALDRFAGVVKQYYASSNVTVEGFADPAGSASYNKRLSLKRAESVRDYLQGQGLGGQSIKAVGYGETRLVTPNAWGTQQGAELNRRVVFVIESGEATIASANTGL